MTNREAVIGLTDGTPDVPWMVTASANLACRGLDIVRGGIDVVTTANGTYVLEEASSSDIIRPVRPLKETGGERPRSHYGAIELAGTEVEPMGDVKHRVDATCRSVVDVVNTRESLSLEGRKVPATPLSYQLRGYRVLGREQRVSPPDRAGVKA